jgi:zinc protease
MQRMSGPGVWALRGAVAAIVAVLASCGSPRSNVRFGSLEPTRRSVDYEPGIAWWKLDNQLTVAVMPDARENLVSVEVRYLVGAAEDPPGKTGLAHLVEHLRFAMRAAPGGPAIVDRLSTTALRYNAATSWDWTHYSALGLASKLDDLLAIEAARMAAGCDGIDQALLTRERAVVLEEIAQRDAAGLRDPLQRAAFGAQHAYGHSVGGRDVAALTLDDVCRFIDAHYAPSRAILVVSGRLTQDAVRAIAPRFGAIARRATGSRAAVPPVAWTGQATELSAAVDEPGAIVLFPAAPWGSIESIYDDLIDGIILRRLRQEARRESWIRDVTLSHLGGQLGGARMFRFRLSDPGRASDAAAKVYAAIRDLPGRNDDDLILALASARQSELVEAFESIDQRGAWCADFLQYTTHGRFQMQELAELQHLDPARLRERAERLSRDVSRAVQLLPSHNRSAASDAAAATSGAIDMPVWRAEVDPAQAGRPIVLPPDPRDRRLVERDLPNGLHVVMLPDFKQPIFDARLVFPVGETATAGGPQGVALAAARLLSHDPQDRLTPKQRRIVDWVLRQGAPVSWHVSDHTSFRVHGFSLAADGHLWRLHWLLANGWYDPADLSRLKDDAARELARRDRERDGRQAQREALFGRDHPAALDAGTALARNAGALQRSDVERFREAYYRASGATLILVGNFDPEPMMKLVIELFGTWPAEPPPAAAPLPVMHPIAGPTWIADIDREAVQVRVSYAFAASSPRDRRAARLVVGEMIRDRVEQVRSRLGASYGISVDYNLGEAGDVLAVHGQVDAGRAGEAIRQIEADLAGLRAGDAELAADFVRARRAALVRALGDPARSDLAAAQLQALVAHHLPADASGKLAGEIAATTLADAQAVIAQDLQPARMVGMLGGRAPDVDAAFAAAGVVPSQRVTEEPAAAP